MDARPELQRVEALPGAARYALTFRRRDGAEHSVVAELDAGGALAAAASSLPDGWEPDTDAFAAATAVVAALAAARAAGPPAAALRDVPGGWDVGLGNIDLGPSGAPRCTAHGDLVRGADDVFTCTECGAAARLD